MLICQCDTRAGFENVPEKAVLARQHRGRGICLIFSKKTVNQSIAERSSEAAEANALIIDQTWSIRTSEPVDGKRHERSKPLYLLTSAKTFSGAERMAYGLTAQQHTTLFGETTRGGAHATELRKLRPWFRISVPNSRTINPITLTNLPRLSSLTAVN